MRHVRLKILLLTLLLLGVFPAFAQADLTLTANTPLVVDYAGEPISIQYVTSGAETVTVTARSLESIGVIDTSLEVLTPDEVSLASNDDHATIRTDLTRFDSVLSEIELPQAGTYTFVVSTFSGRGAGSIEVLLESEVTASATTAPDKEEEDDADTLIIEDTVPSNSQFEYTFEGTEGETVSILVRALGDLDPVVILNFNSNEVARNDDHGTDRRDIARFDSLISDYQLRDTGTYTIQVRGFAGAGGDFEMTLTRGISQTIEVVSGDADVVTDSLASGETFEYNFSANAGDMYTFTAIATSGDFDPILRIYDNESGQFLVGNDDHGSTDLDLNYYDSRIQRYIFQESGDFVLTLNGYSTTSGRFELTVEPVMSDAPLGNGSEEVVSNSITSNGIFTYEFTAQAGDIISLTARALTSNFDVSLVLISPDGELIADNDDHGTADANLSLRDAHINNFIITESGTYTVEVSGWRDSAGSFALTITTK